MKGPDEPLCLDVNVKGVEQVNVGCEDSDELLFLDNDVNDCELDVMKDISDATDVAKMRKNKPLTLMVLMNHLCLDDNVLIVKQDDV